MKTKSSPFCSVALALMGVLVAAGIAGFGIAFMLPSGFFLIGFIKVYALAVLIVGPISAVLALISLANLESATKTSVALLVFLILLFAFASKTIYGIATAEPALFR